MIQLLCFFFERQPMDEVRDALFDGERGVSEIRRRCILSLRRRKEKCENSDCTKGSHYAYPF
ncbi:MAG TPA: hypothetical protein VJV22_12855 [Acidobacteriaceae bacterium]|nr:hypothetical protein [Acidobacteriaceae bacterium]